MINILGCSDQEVRTLYMHLTSIVTVFLMAATIPAVYYVLLWIIRIMLRTMMSGWMPLDISFKTMAGMAALGWISYGAVALSESRKIRKIPMEEALKNVE